MFRIEWHEKQALLFCSLPCQSVVLNWSLCSWVLIMTRFTLQINQNKSCKKKNETRFKRVWLQTAACTPFLIGQFKFSPMNPCYQFELIYRRHLSDCYKKNHSDDIEIQSHGVCVSTKIVLFDKFFWSIVWASSLFVLIHIFRRRSWEVSPEDVSVDLSNTNLTHFKLKCFFIWCVCTHSQRFKLLMRF